MSALALALVQARTSSTRLPGKVLADIGGEPMLGLLLRRVQQARSVGEVVVATSDRPADDRLEQLGAQLGVRVFRGSLEDVLGRMAAAAAGHDGPVVRLTGDCPLIDPHVVDEVVALLAATPGCRYASNVEPRAHPDGLDVEALAPGLIAELAAEVTDPGDREHVTLAVRHDPQRYGAAALSAEASDLAELRWTVDTELDLAFVRALVARLGDRRHTAGMNEILDAIRQAPSLAAMAGGRRG